METNLIKIENNELQIAKEASEKLKQLYAFKAEFDVKMDDLKNQMLKAMIDNNIKVFENDFMKITLKNASVRKSVDTQALKDAGLYELYLKEVPVKESVIVTWK